MNVEIYKLGMRYETFIRQAHDSKNDEKNGAFHQYMQNLIGFENGEKAIVGFTHQKQLAEIKKYMLSAINAAASRNYSNTVKQEFISYLTKVENATQASDFLNICEKGLELIRNNVC